MKRRYALPAYVAGATAARTGDEMSGPALLLAALAATGSASTASSLLAGVMVSATVGGPLFGVLLDRSAAPGRLLGGALALYAAGLGVLLALVHLDRVPVWTALLVAVAAGLPAPALSGGWTSQLPRVVPPDGLRRATARDAMTFHVASLAGPALAGAVAALYGAPAGVLVSVALICAALPSALTLPAAEFSGVRPLPAEPSAAGPSGGQPPAAEPPGGQLLPAEPPGGQPLAAEPSTTEPPGARPSAAGPSGARPSAVASVPVVAELAAGFRAVARARPLARATAASIVSSVGRGMLIVCCPLLGERAFGTAGHGALLLSVAAASALAANAALSRPRAPAPAPDAVLWLGSLAAAVALLLAATGRPALVLAAMVLAGAGEGPQLTALFAIRHREAPDRLRGQVFTTGASLKITGYALGAALAGPVATWSLPGALLTAAGFEALAVAVCAAFPSAPRSRLRPP
ncbi:MFS transporter [Streptomyces sp. NPDC127033]|uniref:MFS transporter n=1 Tax=Streptomyces sp. NPDC127033 TaxID=3347110 RepID=UPI003662770A